MVATGPVSNFNGSTAIAPGWCKPENGCIWASSQRPFWFKPGQFSVTINKLASKRVDKPISLPFVNRMATLAIYVTI